MEIIQALAWTDSSLSLQEKGVLKKINQGLEYRISIKKTDGQSVKWFVPLGSIIKEKKQLFFESEPIISQEKGLITAIELILAEDKNTLAKYLLPEPRVIAENEELNLLFVLPVIPKKESAALEAPGLEAGESSFSRLYHLEEIFSTSMVAKNLKADRIELISMYYDGLDNIYCLAVCLPQQTLHLFSYSLNPSIKRKFKNKYVGKINEKSTSFQALMHECNQGKMLWFILTDKEFIKLQTTTGRDPFHLEVSNTGDYKDHILFIISNCGKGGHGIMDKNIYYYDKSSTNIRIDQPNCLHYSRKRPLVIPFSDSYYIIGGISSIKDFSCQHFVERLYQKYDKLAYTKENKVEHYYSLSKGLEYIADKEIAQEINDSFENYACVVANKILIFQSQSLLGTDIGYFYSYEPLASRWQRCSLESPFLNGAEQEEEEEDIFDFPGNGENDKSNLSCKVGNIEDNACVAYLNYKNEDARIIFRLYRLQKRNSFS